jgi:hypothetical protein
MWSRKMVETGRRKAVLLDITGESLRARSLLRVLP